jgi:hypothetical protein
MTVLLSACVASCADCRYGGCDLPQDMLRVRWDALVLRGDVKPLRPRVSLPVLTVGYVAHPFDCCRTSCALGSCGVAW